MSADLFEDPIGGRARIGTVGDSAPDDYEVGAFAYGVRRRGYPFLVTLFGPRGTDPRRENDESFRGNALADQADFVRRSGRVF